MSNLAFVLIFLSLIAYLWFGGAVHLLFGIHLPPIVVALAAYIGFTLLFLRRRVEITPWAKTILQISFVLVIWMFIVNLFTTPLALTLRVVGGRVLIGVVIAFCIYYFAGQINRLRSLTYILIAGVLVSTLVGIGQYFVGEPFISLWLQTGGLEKMMPALLGGQIAGLAAFSVPLAYQISATIPLLFGLLISRSPSRAKKIMWVILIILIIGLMLTGSRSSFIGVPLGLIAIALVSSGKNRLSKAFLLFLVAIIGYVVIALHFAPRFLMMDAAALARVPLTLATLGIALNYPLGTGLGGFTAAAAEIFPQVAHLPGAELVLVTTSHNQFLNVLGYYGIPGFFLLVVFYVVLFKGLKTLRSRSTGNQFLTGMQIGLLGSFIAYVVESSFHNAGPFIGDPVHWYFIGIALALDRITRKIDARVRGPGGESRE